MQSLLLIAIGIVVGIMSGLCGIGGGILVVPALIYFFHYTQHEAQGTSLAMLLPPIGLLAVWRYWQAGHVKFIPALLLASAFAIGAFVGAHFAVRIPQTAMRRLFGAMVTVIGLYMTLRK